MTIIWQYLTIFDNIWQYLTIFDFKKVINSKLKGMVWPYSEQLGPQIPKRISNFFNCLFQSNNLPKLNFLNGFIWKYLENIWHVQALICQLNIFLELDQIIHPLWMIQRDFKTFCWNVKVKVKPKRGTMAQW